MSLKVAFVVDALFPDRVGGIQKYSTELVKHLAMKGVEIEVYTQEDCPLAIEILKPYKVSVMHVESKQKQLGPFSYLIANRGFSKEVFNILKTRDCQIVYAQGFTGIGESKIKGPFPVVHNLHGLEMYQPTKGFKSGMIAFVFRREVNRILRNAKHVISLGAKLSNIIDKVNPNLNISEIPNAIGEGWLENAMVQRNHAVTKFLFVGRYEWRKGFDTMNAAITQLKLDPNCKFEMDFIGNIPKHAQLDLAGIRYLGELRDEARIKEVYSKCDVLINASYSEGMPTVILEAMASGMAVIATDVGASGALVNQENGRLIQPYNVGGLAGAMQDLCNKSQSELQQMGLVSVERVKKDFSWVQIADKHIQVFKQICRTA
jgi:glycosyltransferase involved in cell wall biosynthesis